MKMINKEKTYYVIITREGRRLIIHLVNQKDERLFLSSIASLKVLDLKAKGTYTSIMAKYLVSNKDSFEPYWKVLQDWSTCSLKCGGGSQVLQRICIKPNNSKASCKGKDTLERSCNTQPCDEHERNSKTLNPIIKQMKLSNTYQKNIVSNLNIISFYRNVN